MRADLAPLAALQVPAPPPPPPPLPGVPTAPGVGNDAAARLAEELAKAREDVAGIAGQGDGRGNVSILRDGEGRTVVRTSDGREIIIDPRAVPSEDAQQAIIHEAISSAPPPPPAVFDQGPPQNAIILTAIMLFFATLIVIGFPLARAGARRMDRKAAGPHLPDDLAPRLDRLEQAVEAVAVEMERVSEAQRFSARLLSERLPEALPRLDAAAAESMQRRRVEG
ncbi:MAG: hypothetical protein ACXWZS_18715 [Gemmatirosa sp.]